MIASSKHHRYWVYMVASKPNGTLYVGVTSSIERRMWEHRTGALSDFTKTYGVQRLVYFEEFRQVAAAIAREKELKGWLRVKKIALIRQANPLWKDLADDWLHVPMDSSLRSE